ncbi:3-deoxy-7-phosphoheptulonate synthase, partial [Ascosphaera pollenicola]
ATRPGLYSSLRAGKITPPTLERSPASSSSLPDYDKEKTPKATTPRFPPMVDDANDLESEPEADTTPRSASTTALATSRPSSSYTAEGGLTRWPDWDDAWSPGQSRP